MICLFIIKIKKGTLIKECLLVRMLKLYSN